MVFLASTLAPAPAGPVPPGLAPLPPGGPGAGPDCHFPLETVGFGPTPARIRGVVYFLFVFWP